MKLAPFGNLHAWQTPYLTDPFEPVKIFQGSPAEYKSILETWYQEVQDSIWPLYDRNGKWQGGASKFAEAAVEAELRICLSALQDKNVLRDFPDSVPTVPEANRRDHLWHFRVEDAMYFAKGDELLPEVDRSFDFHASRDVGSNFIAYTDKVSGSQFAELFWRDHGDREPRFLSIKNQFQRPRPWTAAAAFRLDTFTWHRADALVHTGIHPAFPSGHCYQGLVHSSHVLSGWRKAAQEDGPAVSIETELALMQYAVDWGDRRVFAGIHYPTDNIASWILALRLLPHMYGNGKELADFVRAAITSRSLIYKMIHAEFGRHDALKPALKLLDDNV